MSCRRPEPSRFDLVEMVRLVGIRLETEQDTPGIERQIGTQERPGTISQQTLHVTARVQSVEQQQSPTRCGALAQMMQRFVRPFTRPADRECR